MLKLWGAQFELDFLLYLLMLHRELLYELTVAREPVFDGRFFSSGQIGTLTGLEVLLGCMLGRRLCQLLRFFQLNFSSLLSFYFNVRMGLRIILLGTTVLDLCKLTVWFIFNWIRLLLMLYRDLSHLFDPVQALVV